MALKSLDELKQTNLKGYYYYKDAWGMTMTSRNAYEPELWVVLEDDGDNCVVAECGHESWTKTFPKELVCKLIAGYPAIDAKTYSNKIRN